MSLLSSFLSFNPTLLLSYKCPLFNSIFNVKPNLSLSPLSVISTALMALLKRGLLYHLQQVPLNIFFTLSTHMLPFLINKLVEASEQNPGVLQNTEQSTIWITPTNQKFNIRTTVCMMLKVSYCHLIVQERFTQDKVLRSLWRLSNISEHQKRGMVAFTLRGS